MVLTFGFTGCQTVGQVKKDEPLQSFVLGHPEFPVTVGNLSGFKPDLYSTVAAEKPYLVRVINNSNGLRIVYQGYWWGYGGNTLKKSIFKSFTNTYKNFHKEVFGIKPLDPQFEKVGEQNLEVPDGRIAVMEMWEFRLGKVYRKIAIVNLRFKDTNKKAMLVIFRQNGKMKADPGDVVALLGFSVPKG